MLIATHLRREAALADRLLTLRDGRIVGDARRGTAAFEAARAEIDAGALVRAIVAALDRGTAAAEVAEAARQKDLWSTPDDVWAPGRGQGNTAGAAG